MLPSIALDRLERLVCYKHLLDQLYVTEGIKRGGYLSPPPCPSGVARQDAGGLSEFIGSAVSKTVNLPSASTRQDLFDIFLQAYESGLKGITVYRDGSRASQPFYTGEVGVDLVRAYFPK